MEAYALTNCKSWKIHQSNQIGSDVVITILHIFGSLPLLFVKYCD